MEAESAADAKTRQRSRRRRDLLLTLALGALCIALALMPPRPGDHVPDRDSRRAPAKVLEVDNSAVQQMGLVKAGSQRLTVRLQAGSQEGTELEIINQLLAKMDLDEIYREGDVVLLEYALGPDGEIRRAVIRGRYRVRLTLILVLLFALLLLTVAGWTGLKALVSFVFAALMLWRVLIPAFLAGYDPIPVALGVVVCLTAAICLLVGGVNRKGLVAATGAFLGLALTCALALLFQQGFKVHGAVRPFAETLLYAGYGHLDLTRIFLAGIFLAASGAVMDLAMDISAAVDEIAQRRPDLSRRDLILSGLRVGRAVIGTMTTTLLLAYSGHYLTMMMLLQAQGVPLVNILNHNYIAAEVLHTMVGSFGLVSVAPFTALVGGLLCGASRQPEPEDG